MSAHRSYCLSILAFICILTICIFAIQLLPFNCVGPSNSAPQIELNFTAGDCQCKLEGFESDYRVNCSCPDIIRQPRIEKNVIIQENVERPWWAEGKVWHYPPKFPRCSMDSCFNFSRCSSNKEMLIYSYESLNPSVRYFAGFNNSKWHTPDPEKACLFFFFLDNDFKPWGWKINPLDAPFWNGGMNHVLITFADQWKQKGPPEEDIGFASIMATDLHETTYRPGFDVGISLPPKFRFEEFQSTKALDRKYFLTFRGLRYVGDGEGTLRSSPLFRQMHNGDDIIVATSCSHFVVQEIIKQNPSLGAFCDDDEKLYSNYTYNQLMNSTFGLVPAGIQPNSYRFLEVLSAGSIPVLIADNYVKPIHTLAQWHLCLLQFPSGEMHRIVPTLKALKIEEIERRQIACLQIYNSLFSSDEIMLESSIQALRARFLGA